MNKWLYKAGDTLFCLMGFVAVALIFAGIIIFGKPAGKLAHCPLDFFVKSARSYSVSTLP
jgi:hypothetical protein